MGGEGGCLAVGLPADPAGVGMDGGGWNCFPCSEGRVWPTCVHAKGTEDGLCSALCVPQAEGEPGAVGLGDRSGSQ